MIDSSALIAILTGEPEQDAFAERIAGAARRLIGAPSMLETSMVMLARTGEDGIEDLRNLSLRGALETVPFTAEHLELAVNAFRQFGKGRHPAALNFGDCCAYALAKATGEPLLFKGDDFSRTDIRRAL